MSTKPLLAVLCAALVIAACASSPRAQAPAVSAATPGAAGEECTPRNGALLADGSRECGTNGRVYDGETLRSTGAQHVGDALTQVDSGLTPVH
jgi:hypothetical protein